MDQRDPSSVEIADAAPQPDPSWKLARRIFLGGIAATYAIAFGSLAAQVQGLFGSQGIAPLAERMTLLAERLTGSARLQLPSLLWFGAGDAWLGALCWIGLALALLALAGFLPRLALGLCWVVYLSFVRVGFPFLNFQWDALLLEAGLLAVVWAPDGLRPFGRTEREPSRAGRWLVYWLLFRLMLLSGLVKIDSGDPSWLDGTALDFHYWTQPLPNRFSHYAHWMPDGFKHFSVLVVFAIELGAPCLLLVPWKRRRLRQIAAAAFVFFMVVISATGNYGFFNFLTCVLCIPLLDDRAWRALSRARRAPPPPVEDPPAPPWRKIVLACFAIPAVAVTSWPVYVELRTFCSSRAGELIAIEGPEEPPSPPAPIAKLIEWTEPFECFNSYGLFRVMTKERPEILVEGSQDGVSWKTYGFRYKPDELGRAPVFAGLYMPRLDWQLWFAAMEYRWNQRSAWTRDFLERLLEGSPSVLALLGTNPFPDGPPRYVRASVALYEFSTPAERASGIWWKRGDPRPFLPQMERAR